MAPLSITSRLLGGTALVLMVFVVLTGLAVRYSVYQRAENALHDRLQGLVYGILGAAEISEQTGTTLSSDDATADQNSLIRPVTQHGAQLVINTNELPDPRLGSSVTGLYAEVVASDRRVIWRSTSTTRQVPDTQVTPIGEWQFESIAARTIRVDNQSVTLPGVHRLQLATVWELDSGDELPFIVHVVSHSDEFKQQLRRFDRTLWASLAAAALALLLVQLGVLLHSLKPLNRLGDQLGEIEQGQRAELDDELPRELAPLAESINLLLASERHRHGQYRHLLDDLAHSLKTPLSVLHNVADTTDTPSPLNTRERHVVQQQTDQMKDTMQRYLQRASFKTPQYLVAPLSPVSAAERIVSSLQKIYHTPPITCSINLPDDCRVRIAEADLFDVFGNVLDNACKYGADRIDVHWSPTDRTILVDDNGPGFPADILSMPGTRGLRADTQSVTALEGQGIGLAATRDLLNNVGGDLQLANLPAGGARVSLSFP